MATGQNLQPNRGAVTSDVTPGANLGTGEAEMWNAASRLADQVNELAAPIVRRKAEEVGKREGAAAAAETAAGRPAEMPRSLLPFGDAFEARTAAAGAAYQAGVRSDFDAREAQARINNPANVEGYEREMTAVRSSFIQNADPRAAGRSCCEAARPSLTALRLTSASAVTSTRRRLAHDARRPA